MSRDPVMALILQRGDALVERLEQLDGLVEPGSEAARRLTEELTAWTEDELVFIKRLAAEINYQADAALRERSGVPK